jgi:hypothetical protein
MTIARTMAISASLTQIPACEADQKKLRGMAMLSFLMGVVLDYVTYSQAR